MKPRASVLLLLALVSGAPTAAASGWQWLSPTPGGFPIAGIAAPAARTGFFVGAQGTILSTTNGGASFVHQLAPTDADLNGVFFLPDAETGWIVGDSGTILHTTDGGATWTAEDSGTTSRLYAVFFTDAQHGFAAGEDRTLLQTADGGATWTGRDGQMLTVNALDFVDAQHGFAVGWAGGVLLTIDGGASWSLVQTSANEDLLAVSFSDLDHGWAVGVAGTILVTADGGRSWQAQGQGLTGDDLVGVAAQSPTAVYAVGQKGAFYYSADGLTWKKSSLWFWQDTLTSLALAPDGTLWAGGGDGHVFMASAAEPGQQFFLDENRGLDSADTVAALAFADPLHGVLAVGYFLYYTADGGRTLDWAPVSSPPGAVMPGWEGVAMTSATHAIAVGTGGAIALSDDGGKSWTPVGAGTAPDGGIVNVTENDLYAVACPTATRCYAAGGYGVILSSDDSGKSWTVTTAPGANSLRAFWFSDATHGVAVGDFGVVETTADGTTWSLTGPQASGQDLYAVGGVPPGLLFAAGAQGYALASIDQGLSWQPIGPPVQGDIHALFFADPENGFLVTGRPGVIYVTRDGGLSWRPQLSGLPALSALAFTDLTHGFAAGAGGSLLGTVTGGESPCATASDCPENDGGEVGYACETGACVPCNVNPRCGPGCSPCDGATPFCRGAFCGQCWTSSDCSDGGACIAGGCVLNTPLPDAGAPGDAGVGALDGGPPDGGSTDAGTYVSVVAPDAGNPPNGPPVGCGCGAGSGGAASLVWLAMAALLWRKRSVSGRWTDGRRSRGRLSRAVISG